jgi:hypothetical protein
VQWCIEQGRLTEDEYREREARRLTERRAELGRRVPAAVLLEGPAAVEEWVDGWLTKRDPRWLLLEPRSLRDPL